MNSLPRFLLAAVLLYALVLAMVVWLPRLECRISAEGEMGPGLDVDHPADQPAAGVVRDATVGLPAPRPAADAVGLPGSPASPGADPVGTSTASGTDPRDR